ncbi:MAG: peptide deformylase [Ruminococcaceae bacterium]|nr:peptide deformylase [Oscillospiraceae bacterium]
MIRPIMKDPFFLSQKSRPAAAADLPIAQDLLDTLRAHAGECVGMAANMIGQAVRIIVFDQDGVPTIMLNPEIIGGLSPYDAEEGCLSLPGVRKTKRYQVITVRYQDMAMREHTEVYTGWTAQIIQHEADHLNGILI